jgi:integrase
VEEENPFALVIRQLYATSRGMARTPSFKIRQDKKRATAQWIVNIPPRLSETGKRQQRFFKTKLEAEGEVTRIKNRREKFGTSAKLLTPTDEQQAVTALKLLRERGITLQLSEVVGDYIQRWEERNASRTLSDVWDDFIKKPRKKPLGRAYLNSMRFAKMRLEPLHGVLVADINTTKIEACLSGLSTSYQEATLTRVKAVLNHAIKKQWLRITNPIDDSSIVHPTRLGNVEIYTPSQIKKLLETTISLYPELVPAVATMTFGGIRPDAEDGEITKLDWSHIILSGNEKRISLPATITKTSKKRMVNIRPALSSWLGWHKATGGSTTGLVCPYRGTALRNRLRELFKQAQLPRIQDGLRHSFASYLVPIIGKEKTSLELGHSAGDVLEKHYLDTVIKSEAQKFWKLNAPVGVNDSKIVHFKAA